MGKGKLYSNGYQKSYKASLNLYLVFTSKVHKDVGAGNQINKQKLWNEAEMKTILFQHAVIQDFEILRELQVFLASFNGSSRVQNVSTLDIVH